jgi:hypothetical protein
MKRIDEIWCEVHGCVHEPTRDPYQYGYAETGDVPECGPEDWRALWVGGPSGHHYSGYVIMNPAKTNPMGEPLYWNQQNGWVQRRGATVYPFPQRAKLPSGGTWVGADREKCPSK